jgi:phosphoenolpyruvate-protein kinase (PTS system EI component)
MLSENAWPISLLHVMGISPGIAIGPVRLYRPVSPAVEMTKISLGQVEVERQRLQQALDAAVGELHELSEHVAQTVGRSEADIFEAQQLMLQDPELLTEITELITQQHFSAAAALHQAAEHQAQELELLENETLAARASDMRDVAARAIRHLRVEKMADERSGADSTPQLIVAYDLTPSDTATFDPKTILGICTVVGGPTTHAAIIARAMEIPAIAGLDAGLLDLLHDGQQIAIDGAKGLLYLQLDAGQQQELRTLMRQQQQ